MSPIYVPGKVVLRKTWQPMDADAAAYITAVETADGQALEEKVKIAIDNFVLGCKADGIWSAIKASCILAGARTLSGALVPLVGTAPTNNNFVSGDYNRKTGLVGNGSTKQLNSNRANNADPQNNNHNAVYVSALPTAGTNTVFIGTESSVDGRNVILSARSVGVVGFANRITGTTNNDPGVSSDSTGLIGHSRASSTVYTVRAGGSRLSVNSTSSAAGSTNVFVFSYAATGYTTARLAFYSIGESLDLTRLDARVTDLITAIGVAIP